MSHATSITGHLRAESGLDVYLSDSAGQLGDHLGGLSGSDPFPIDADIADGVTQYLHIVVHGGSRFIGSLELEGDDFVFTNGAFSLSTSESDWIANETGVGMAGTTIVDLGPNGTDPGGLIYEVARDARYIWTGTGSGDRFFTVSLIPSDHTSSHAVSIKDTFGYVAANGPNPVSRSLAGEDFDATAESDKGWLSADAKIELSEESGAESIEGSFAFEAGDFLITAPEGAPGLPIPAVEGSLNIHLRGFLRIGVGSESASVEQATSDIVFDRIEVRVFDSPVIEGRASMGADHIVGTGNDRTELQTTSEPGFEFLLPGPEHEVEGSMVSEYYLPIDEILTTDLLLLPLDEPFPLSVEMDWVLSGRSTLGNTLSELELVVSLPETGDVFNLPEGATVNSTAAGVTDNRYSREGSNPSFAEGIFLEVDGVEGESTAMGYEGWVDVTDFFSSVSRTRGFGRRRAAPVWEDLIVAKELDRSSVKLAEAITKGNLFDEVVLVYNKAERGGDWLSYEYRLKEALVTSYHIDGAAGEQSPSESVSFSFNRIDWIYTKFGPDGLKEGKVEAWWDLEKGYGASTSSTGDNEAPSIEPVGDISADPGTEGTVELTIGDLETAADDLVITLSTDRPELLGGIEITGTGTTRTVSYKTSALRSGFATIVATLSDGVDTRSISIPVLIGVEMTPYEAYLSAYFSEEETFDPMLTGPLSDPDKDGLATQIEFLLGTNPREYSPPAEAVKVDTGDSESEGKAFTLTYKRRKDDPNVIGALWGSDNGKDWFRLDSSNPLYEETVESGSNPLFEEVKVTYTLPTGGEPAFIRFQSTAAF